MSSLSSYDRGKKSFEGRRYKDDIEVSHAANETLLAPLWAYNSRQKKNKEKQYWPEMWYLLGNHENRINRAVEDDAKLEGVIGIHDLKLEAFGWQVVPFLKPKVIDGVAYCHYFPTGTMGRAATSARAIMNKMHMSCVAGHLQGRDIAYGKRADGKQITTIISGSFYMHDEEYLSPLTNEHWRGLWMFHEVNDGAFDEMPVSLRFLLEKYNY
jgi:hypothetical protein